ncbi:hypothetical protein HYH03_000262 [Edaphochlamys debaryana]|uniref:alpha,alpha-trehalose-phosphate synthase (UDP-forming) n=1 Tax=Edaphochlamys debaryana TaxID=47281 RepID=A0A836C7G6_9CHLO|nr:hypothetical protein HYH03_000262 [Edaphochlamys debaryana]|eukprot:KAG2501762.1 hypothetical protein HYH03_000262 [Edaphochlamys debaryana]
MEATPHSTPLQQGMAARGSMSSLPDLAAEECSTSLPTTRVDRLLRERIRRNRSHQAFDVYEDPPPEDPVLETVPEPLQGARLVVVANRLPVTVSKDASGRWQLQASAGGLVSALKGVSSYVTLWIGWPGIWVKPGRERDDLAAILKQEGFVPVWMDHTLLDLYYNGFCNSVLWQLFHYVPLNIDSWQKMAEHRAMQMQWQAYQVANEKFADVVLSEYLPSDAVWVQDYHLMLLPSLLKQAVHKMKVGFFLHTPFPSSEIYRTLPVREEVLRAVLAADLVGFHTYDYARHFISSCTRILGLEGTPEGVENNGVLTRVGTFPIGIDPERFTRALESEEVQSQTAKLLNRYAGRKIMLGVDRLDMVKGIPQKLLAYEKFLEEHPEWRDKVLLVQIAVPSRTDVPEYQKLRSMVHEIVGRINGQYGTLTYVPIYHLDTSLSFTELCALYAVTDVAMVTSLRDGMNLVSYEYVACQSDNAGVLVLSEFAGAAQSLGAGALLVNPWNISDMAAAIYDALSMSEEERRERHRQNYMHVQTHTAQHWADTFITELNDTHIEADLRMKGTPPPLDVPEVVRAYQSSRRRLIVLGYNATLTTSVEAPRLPKRQFEQVKALAKVNPRVMQSVCELCQDPANVVVIFSGSETSKLDEVFGHLPVWLAAENGVYVRPAARSPPPTTPRGQSTPGTSQGDNQGSQARPPLPQWKCVFDQVHCEWMESVQLVFDYFCERTPRSFVEARETSLVWNYKYADVEFGRIQARDLLQHLWTGPISNAPVEIIQGGKSVEVRPVGVTKGLAMQRLVAMIAVEGGIEAAAFDMVLCIGHLLGRDENLFSLFEGARIDGAAPAHNSRAERFANAVALANATGNGELGGIAALGGAAERARQRAAAAAAAAGGGGGALGLGGAGAGHGHAPGHNRSSSAGGIHLVMEEGPPTGRFGLDLPTGKLGSDGPGPAPPGRPPSASGTAAAPGGVPGLGAAAAGGGGSGGGAPGHPPPLRMTSGIAQALAAATQGPHSPFAHHSATALPSSTSPKSNIPVPMAGGRVGPSGGALLSPTHPHPQPHPHAQPGQHHADGLGPGAGHGHGPSGLGRTSGGSGGGAPPSAAGGPGPGADVPAGFRAGPGHLGGSGPGAAGPAAVRHAHRAPLSTQSMDRHDMGRAVASAMASNATSAADRLAGIFPPKYLYTCTVGRNRSKARYALATSAEVGDLLEAVVQQGIYNRPPTAMCAASAPADFGVGSLPAAPHQMHMAAGGRMDSASSSEPLSPDSILASLAMAGKAPYSREAALADRANSIALASEEASSLPHSPGPLSDFIPPPHLASLAAQAAQHHSHRHGGVGTSGGGGGGGNSGGRTGRRSQSSGAGALPGTYSAPVPAAPLLPIHLPAGSSPSHLRAPGPQNPTTAQPPHLYGQPHPHLHHPSGLQPHLQPGHGPSQNAHGSPAFVPPPPPQLLHPFHSPGLGGALHVCTHASPPNQPAPHAPHAQQVGVHPGPGPLGSLSSLDEDPREAEEREGSGGDGEEEGPGGAVHPVSGGSGSEWAPMQGAGPGGKAVSRKVLGDGA